MKRICGLMTTVALLAGTAQVLVAQDAKIDDRLDQSRAVIQEIMHTPDRGIPQSILAGAHCVIVIPGYKKAAFVFGGQYGQGVATCRTGHGWSAPVFVQLEGEASAFRLVRSRPTWYCWR